MASIDLSTHGVQSQVVVTLDYINTRRPRDPADDDSFKREFILTPDSPMMPIARATSRPEGRGKAARNNAFFNSPIISRKHAELFIEPASKDHIYIKDLGSMHGTALNGNSIKEGKHLIRNGDLVTLGQIVVQGNKIFKSRTFQVRYRREPYKHSTTSRHQSAAVSQSRATAKPHLRIVRVPEKSTSSSYPADDVAIYRARKVGLAKKILPEKKAAEARLAFSTKSPKRGSQSLASLTAGLKRKNLPIDSLLSPNNDNPKRYAEPGSSKANALVIDDDHKSAGQQAKSSTNNVTNTTTAPKSIYVEIGNESEDESMSAPTAATVRNVPAVIDIEVKQAASQVQETVIGSGVESSRLAKPTVQPPSMFQQYLHQVIRHATSAPPASAGSSSKLADTTQAAKNLAFESVSDSEAEPQVVPAATISTSKAAVTNVEDDSAGSSPNQGIDAVFTPTSSRASSPGSSPVAVRSDDVKNGDKEDVDASSCDEISSEAEEENLYDEPDSDDAYDEEGSITMDTDDQGNTHATLPTAPENDDSGEIASEGEHDDMAGPNIVASALQNTDNIGAPTTVEDRQSRRPMNSINMLFVASNSFTTTEKLSGYSQMNPWTVDEPMDYADDEDVNEGYTPSVVGDAEDEEVVDYTDDENENLPPAPAMHFALDVVEDIRAAEATQTGTYPEPMLYNWKSSYHSAPTAFPNPYPTAHHSETSFNFNEYHPMFPVNGLNQSSRASYGSYTNNATPGTREPPVFRLLEGVVPPFFTQAELPEQRWPTPAETVAAATSSAVATPCFKRKAEETNSDARNDVMKVASVVNEEAQTTAATAPRLIARLKVSLATAATKSTADTSDASLFIPMEETSTTSTEPQVTTTAVAAPRDSTSRPDIPTANPPAKRRRITSAAAPFLLGALMGSASLYAGLLFSPESWY